MNSEDFSISVKKLSPVQDAETIRYWKNFADECVEHGSPQALKP